MTDRTDNNVVIYVALGPHRLRAAAEHCAALAAAGQLVHLVLPDTPPARQVAPAEGVTVHRVDARSSRASTEAAARLVLGGSLPAPSLLIAGDMEAMTVAWSAQRQSPGLTVRFQPAENPDRRPAPADLAVVTPWYPSPADQFSGSFVKSAIQVIGGAYDRVSILHTQEWGLPRRWHESEDRLRLAAGRIAQRSGTAVVEDLPEGELTRVATPTVTWGNNYSARVNDHIAALAATLPTGLIDAPLIHAHTGIYGGVAAVELARDDTRIVVTEHASFLPRILGHLPSRNRYLRMLKRIDVLLCVSRSMRDQLTQAFPSHRRKFRVVPNVVDLDAFPVRPTPVDDLRRWLYVGRLVELKRVVPLVDSFAQVAADDPTVSLTIVGSGDQENPVRQRIDELQLGDRVDVRPPVAPESIPALLHAHDLLVHNSRSETFGMTVVEAVATSTPVLAARSEGPAETLDGLEGAAGSMFDISDDPSVLVEAFGRLRKRLPALDLVAARESLQQRYGPPTVRAALLAAYRLADGTASPATATAEESAAIDAEADRADSHPGDRDQPGESRVVLLAVNPSDPTSIRDLTDAVLAQGHAVDLVTADTVTPSRIRPDGRVRVLSIAEAENRNPILRAERLLVFKLPGKALAVALDMTRGMTALGPEVAILRLQRKMSSLSSVMHHRVFQRGYAMVRPRLLWRIARKRVVPQLDLDATRRVIVIGSGGIAIGWHLAKRNRDMTVTTSREVTFEAEIARGLR